MTQMVKHLRRKYIESAFREQAWSNGRFRSLEHGVSLEKGERRCSMILVLDACPSTHIEAPPEVIDYEHPSLFLPFTVRDFQINFEKIRKRGNFRVGMALDFARRQPQ